jgi:ABC-type nitrate/sulfonate/bicarbonate transport system substrate-binding protein
MVASRREFFKVTAPGLVVLSGLGPRLRLARAQGATVRIGTAVLGDYSLTAPILVALDRGFFKAQGVGAEFQPFQGGPTLLKALLAKQIDIGVTGATDVPVFRGAGAPVRYIASQVNGNHFTLNVATGIGQLGELKGKSIGVTVVGSTTWISAVMLARREGWDPERDVKIVPLGGLDAQLAALARGETHAFVWGDGGAVTELAGKSKVLLRFDSLMPKWISQAYYASDDYIKASREPIGLALRALFQGVRFIRESPKEAAAIAARTLKWPEEAVARANQISGPLLSVDGKLDVEAIEVMQTTLMDLKVLKQRLPTQDLYTAEFTPVRL